MPHSVTDGLRVRSRDPCRSALPCIAGALRRSLLGSRRGSASVAVRSGGSRVHFLSLPLRFPPATGSLCRRATGTRPVHCPFFAMWPGVWAGAPEGVKRRRSGGAIRGAQWPWPLETGSKPGQATTGSGGYRGNAESVRERSQRTNREPRPLTIRRAWTQREQSPAEVGIGRSVPSSGWPDSVTIASWAAARSPQAVRGRARSATGRRPARPSAFGRGGGSSPSCPHRTLNP
jgi:hypothetical protein